MRCIKSSHFGLFIVPLRSRIRYVLAISVLIYNELFSIKDHATKVASKDKTESYW